MTAPMEEARPRDGSALLSPDMALMPIADSLTAFFELGYVRLGNVLSSSGAALLRARCDDLMLGRRTYGGMFFQHDSPSGRYEDLSYGKGWVGPSLHYRKVEGLELDPVLLAWIENPLFRRLANAAIGDDVSLYRAVLWNKAAHAGTELPWHQDDGKFWGIDRAPFLQVWTALDDASEQGGCVEVVPGSHKHGLASPEGGTVRAAELSCANAQQRSVKLPAKAGDVILLHNHLWHRSGINATASTRRAISISYLSGQTRCLRKRRAPRTFRRVFQTPAPQASSGDGALTSAPETRG